MVLAEIRRVSSETPAFFRYRLLDGQVLVTNDFGDWHWLTQSEFRGYVEGTLDKGGPTYQALAERSFVKPRLDSDKLVQRVRRQRAFLRSGPALHALALTTRTREGGDGQDMPVEVAERAVDCLFMSTSTRLVVELTGGDPLLALPVARHVVDYALRKNVLARKDLSFVMATSLDGMNDDALRWIVEHGVRVRSEAFTAARAGTARDPALGWTSRLDEAYEAQGHRDLRVESRLQPGGEEHSRLQGWVAELVSRGSRIVSIEPLTALDRQQYPEAAFGWDLERWLETYERALDDMLELATAGAPVVERAAAAMLTRILTDLEPNLQEFRSPSSAGIGELAYAPDGGVYTCRHALTAAMLGDETFRIGSLQRQGYHDLVSHPTVRALVMATTLDAQPGWIDHAYKPYCGVCPVLSYLDQGSIQGRMTDSPQTIRQVHLLDVLFRKLRTSPPDTRATLERWANTGV